MAPPINDDFLNAILITGGSGSLSPVDISEATSELSEPNTTIAKSIWYKWVPPAAGSYEFDTMGSIAADTYSAGPDGYLDTKMAVYWIMPGDPETFASLQGGTYPDYFNDDRGGATYTSAVYFDAVADGRTYYIQVGVYDSSYNGQIITNWGAGTPPPPPPNPFSVTADAPVNIDTPGGSATSHATVNISTPPHDGTVTITFANPPATGTITWSVTPTPGVISSTTTYTFSFTASGDIPVGYYNFEVDVTDGTFSASGTVSLLVGKRQLRDSLDDIVGISYPQTNGGLRHFTGGSGYYIGEGDPTSPPVVDACGTIEHAGHPVFFWSDSIDFNATTDFGVASWNGSTFDFLGKPLDFVTEPNYTPVGPGSFDIGHEPTLVSDGTDLYFVALVQIASVIHFIDCVNYSGDHYTAYLRKGKMNLVCMKYVGGTSWEQYGFSTAITSNREYRMNTIPACYDGDIVIGGITYAHLTDNYGFDAQYRGGSGYASASASPTEPGVIYAGWWERGPFDIDPEQLDVTHTTTLDTIQWGWREVHSYMHSVKFTGGATDDITLEHAGGLDWDDTTKQWLGGMPIVTPLKKPVVRNSGSVPFLFWPYGDSSTQLVYPNTYNAVSGTVINSTWPDVAWGDSVPNPLDTTDSSLTFTYSFPEQMVWISSFNKYAMVSGRTAYSVGPDRFRIITLNGDGTGWEVLAHHGSTAVADNILIDKYNGIPALIDIETTNIYLWASSGQYSANLRIWAWIPCPETGPFDSTTWWDIMPVGDLSTHYLNESYWLPNPPYTVVPFAEYVGPIPNGSTTWNFTGPYKTAVRIGESIFAIVGEKNRPPYYPNTGQHADYYVYEFKIGRANRTGCPNLPIIECPPSVIWFFKDGEWRQQNVDTTYSLWFFKDGQWHKNCNELYARITGDWKN